MNNPRLWLWLIPGLAYLAFWGWYTNLGGALSDEEIESFVARMQAQERAPEQIEFLRRFMQEDDGRHFIMINVLDFNDTPPALPATGPDASAQDLLAHYMAHMFPALLSRASHPVFSGTAIFAAMDVVGIDNAQQWDQGALMRYRSRRDLVEITANPAFGERHDYKIAALTKTIAYPVSTDLYYADLRVTLLLVLLVAVLLIDLVIYRR